MGQGAKRAGFRCTIGRYAIGRHDIGRWANGRGPISRVIDGHARPGRGCGADVFGCGGKSCLQERSHLKAGGIYHAALGTPRRRRNPAVAKNSGGHGQEHPLGHQSAGPEAALRRLHGQLQLAQGQPRGALHRLGKG